MQYKSLWIMIESGLFLAVVSTAMWVGAQAKTIETHTDNIAELRSDYKVLAKDLVDTQKDIIKELTRIETKMEK